MLVQQSDQSEPGSYCLDSLKTGPTVWPIRTCVLIPGFPETGFSCLAYQRLCLTKWLSTRLVQPPGQSEPIYIYTQDYLLAGQSQPVLISIEPGATAWPIRACIFPPWCLEARSYLLANQSLNLPTLILRSLLLLAGQSEHVSSYLDSQKPAPICWPIRACIFLPGFAKACSYLLANQSLYPTSVFLVTYVSYLANHSLCLTSMILSNLPLLPGQSEPVSYYLDSEKPPSTGQPLGSLHLSFLHLLIIPVH